LFQALQRAQPGGYAAFLDTGDEQLLSVSPELFFEWREGRLLTRPMKGTAPRGSNPEDDAAQAQALRRSPKERAENVMIVDLLRNDLSRIAEPFSVNVPRLFHTEALPAVWQMTSDVEARTRAGCTLADVFAALFPCGSVTGAPKVRAMRAIRELEAGPRGVYCGAMGVLRPGGGATFNVPIRTVSLRGKEARCGIGSGITSGSVAEAEWQEWRHKRAFLERASAPFEILETLALEAGRLRNLDEHLARMEATAAHFGTPWDAMQLHACLQALRPLARAPVAGRRRAIQRAGLCDGSITGASAPAAGRPPAGRGARRICALQDHATRPLRRFHAHCAGRVRHRAVERAG
jgi:para-aminobenzoate synthetase/4-amino-4-deoxychorismate lyase